MPHQALPSRTDYPALALARRPAPPTCRAPLVSSLVRACPSLAAPTRQLTLAPRSRASSRLAFPTTRSSPARPRADLSPPCLGQAITRRQANPSRPRIAPSRSVPCRHAASCHLAPRPARSHRLAIPCPVNPRRLANSWPCHQRTAPIRPTPTRLAAPGRTRTSPCPSDFPSLGQLLAVSSRPPLPSLVSPCRLPTSSPTHERAWPCLTDEPRRAPPCSHPPLIRPTGLGHACPCRARLRPRRARPTYPACIFPHLTILTSLPIATPTPRLAAPRRQSVSRQITPALAIPHRLAQPARLTPGRTDLPRRAAPFIQLRPTGRPSPSRSAPTRHALAEPARLSSPIRDRARSSHADYPSRACPSRHAPPRLAMFTPGHTDHPCLCLATPSRLAVL